MLSSTTAEGEPSDGSLDSTFENYPSYKGFDGIVRSLAIQGDGKIVVGGGFTGYNGISVPGLARLNTDETLDTTFVTGTGILGGNAVYSLAVQGDGKIVVVGYFSSYNGVSRKNIARINTDGTLDTTFVTTGTGFDSSVGKVVIQGDGKIIVGGSYFTAYNGVSVPRLARLNNDGSLDSTFNIGTGFDSYVTDIAIQGDGKIVVGGYFTTYNGVSVPRLVRLNTDGTLDTTFVQTGTGLSGTVNAVAIQGDGKIIAGGSFTTYDGVSRRYITRLNSDGTLDTTFVVGTGFQNSVNSVVIQGDGKIVVVGDFTTYNGVSRPKLARLNTDGTLDTTFVLTGTGFNSGVYSLAIQGDGKIIVGGLFATYNGVSVPRLARLNTDGTLYTNSADLFSFDIGLEGEAYSLAIQEDGKIVVGGYFTSFNEVSRLKLARLNTNGTLDTTFVTGTGVGGTAISTVAIQGDGKIVVGGYFSTYNGVPRVNVARINTDGTIDTTFVQTGTGLGNTPNALAIQGDGKIIVGGSFTTYNGVSVSRIARLNSDGTLDTTFVTGTGLNSDVKSVTIQDDGKIIVGGYFTTYNGVSVPRLVRLNTDGTLDTTFVQTGTGLNSTVNAVAIQDDGKIIVGGGFTTYNGVSRPRLARLNSDGTLDTTFVTGTGLNGYVYSVAIQGEGKIIVGGGFVTYNGASVTRLARLNTDGTLDTTFVQTGTGLNADILSVAIQRDSKIVVGGNFTSYDTTLLSYVTRIYSEPDVYGITYNLDGGTNSGSNPATYTIVTPTISLGVPTKTGYTFSGWYSGAEFTNAITQIPLGSTEDVTLFAKWAVAEYDITYNLDSGTNNGSNPATYTIETQTITLLEPTKTGYTFSGWYSEAEFTNAITQINLGSTGDIVLYAKWTINTYAVSFNGNNNTGGSVPTAITQNYNTQVTVPGNTGSLTKTGYTFNGWNTLANGSGTTYIATNTFNMPSTESILYAQWSINSYNITYNLNSSTNNGSNPATYTVVTPTISLGVPTRTGYTFSGWYSDYKFSNAITQITLGSTGHVTLYAKWNIIPVTIVPPTIIPPVEIVIPEEITEEEIIQVKTILLETADKGDSLNQGEGVKITIGENMIDTKGKKTVHVYKDSGIGISIPVSTLSGEDSGIDNVYAVLGASVVKLTLDTIEDKYVGELTSGNLSGKQNIDILTIFKDSTSKRSNIDISIDPYGYVYTVNKDSNQVRIKDATVTLYRVEDGKRTLYVLTGQDNPQKTDVEGQYSFQVEPGTYVLVVKADGYKDYESEELEVEKTIVEKNIEIEKVSSILDYWGYLVAGLVFVPISIALIKRKRALKF